MKPAEKVAAFGWEELVWYAHAIAKDTGARMFGIVWTHPEMSPSLDRDPPVGIAVTWTAAAIYRSPVRAWRAARQPGGVERHQRRWMVTASAIGPNPPAVICTAVAAALGRLKAVEKISTYGGDLAVPVPTPLVALPLLAQL